MKTLIDEWDCDVEVARELSDSEMMDRYVFNGLPPTYTHTSLARTRFTFKFKNKDLFKCFQYCFDAFGTINNIDWSDITLKCPVGIVKLQDIMTCLTKGAPAKVLRRERGYWK